MNTINANGAFVTLDLILSMIDNATLQGIKLGDLRWRVSPTQRTEIVKILAMGGLSLKDRNDMMVDTFFLASIPGVVDHAVPAGEIWLDQLIPQTVGKATGLMLPKYY